MPPKYHFIDQYSDAWDKVRLGIPTASQMSRIITPGGKPSDSWKDYAYHLLAERLLERPVDTYKSAAMERGSQMEPLAVEWYEWDRDLQTKPIGFITNEARTVGASPDRLVGDVGLLEAKAPMPQTHVKYLLTGEIDKKYWPQLQCQLFVSEREWVDILAWDSVLPRIVIRVTRDEPYIACMEKLLDDFNDYMSKIIEKIKKVTNVPDMPEIRDSQTILAG